MKARQLTITAAVIAALGAGGVAVAQAADGSSPASRPAASGGDAIVTGTGASQARDAAIHATGGGQAGSVEREDDDGYEVDLTRPGGQDAEVELDSQFHATSTETEDADDDHGTDDGHGTDRADDQGVRSEREDHDD